MRINQKHGQQASGLDYFLNNRFTGHPVYQVEIERKDGANKPAFIVRSLFDTLEAAERCRLEVAERTKDQKWASKVVVTESGVKRTDAPSCFRCGERVSVYRFEDGWIGCRQCRVKDLSGE